MQRKELEMSNALIRWPGWGDYPELRHRLDQFFDEFSGGEAGAKLAKLDVIKDEGKLVLRAEMPGIKPDDVKIEVADDVLTVHGEHGESRESKNGKKKDAGKQDAGKRFIRRERSYASFTRSVALPPKVDADKIEATCHDGVVEITVPLPENGAEKVVRITPKAA
jgi:HSP20 family protein